VNNDLEFGKVITTESYFKGQLKNKKIEQHVPEKVRDKSDVLNEVLKAMEIINSGSTDKMTIIIERDRLTKNYKLVTRQFEVVREVHHD
jgi:hypothetical protein